MKNDKKQYHVVKIANPDGTEILGIKGSKGMLLLIPSFLQYPEGVANGVCQLLNENRNYVLPEEI